MDEYVSTERYTVENYVDMGVSLNRVKNSTGMVTAVLNDEQFSMQFALIPPPEPPE